jgi:hypothetical protein
MPKKDKARRLMIAVPLVTCHLQRLLSELLAHSIITHMMGQQAQLS